MLCTVHAGTAEILTHQNGNKLEVTIHPKEAAPEITILNAERWTISGRTALLSDHAIRRHFPFPAETNYTWDRSMSWIKVPLYNEVAPTGRLWESVMEPLHPERPAVAFAAGDKAVLISNIQSTASNIVLTDRTDEANPEPYGLTLRFYGADPDLNPRVRALGLGQPWTMETYPDRAAAPQELRFSLTLINRDEADAAVTAERLPVDRGDARLFAHGKNIGLAGDLRWFIEPGTIEWTHLAALPGRYRIRLELRHSEVSAEGTDLDDAYEVRVNGAPVPLEWTQRNTFATGNAHFGYALTPAVDLSTIKTLSIAASKPWCGQLGGLWLMPE
jgi:hypothetical protein